MPLRLGLSGGLWLEKLLLEAAVPSRLWPVSGGVLVGVMEP